MDSKTSGAWIIHHTNKLQGVQSTPDYDNIGFAGKCGIVLNALAGSDGSDLANDRVEALAAANSISVRTELPTILDELVKQRLIDKGTAGIEILGLTTAQTLEHTQRIFEETSPEPCEKAAIGLSEMASNLPVLKEVASEYLSDTYKIPIVDTGEILDQCKQIGFFDSEHVEEDDIYFNGNIFRRENINKTDHILRSLSADDEKHVLEITEKLKSLGCIAKEAAIEVLGFELYSKLCSIGFFDENSIGNESGTFSFVTHPSAFSKFTNSVVDDAFDLAKAFVTSLTYGMTSSKRGRGRIRMIGALMRKLIDGGSVGPATAIGQDYKVLEMKGVVEITLVKNGLFTMRLLKKEVGELALAVIAEGGVGSTSDNVLPGVSATKYNGPEVNRTIVRKLQTEPLRKGVAHMISNIRTGELR